MHTNLRLNLPIEDSPPLGAERVAVTENQYRLRRHNGTSMKPVLARDKPQHAPSLTKRQFASLYSVHADIVLQSHRNSSTCSLSLSQVSQLTLLLATRLPLGNTVDSVELAHSNR